MKRRKRAALMVVLSGAATIVSVIVMRAAAGTELPPHSTHNPEGFRSAMLWFELAASREEVFAVLGPAHLPDGVARRKQLDTANYYDFAFMVCYSIYNACLIYFVTQLQLYRLTTLLKLRVFLALGLSLAAAMLAGDIVENVQLLAMTKAPDSVDIPDASVLTLMYWTRVKWGAIFVTCLMLCAGYASYFRRIPTLSLSAMYAVAGVTGLVSISLPNARPLLETIGSPAIALAWATSLVHAIGFLVRGPASFPLPKQAQQRRAVAHPDP
ncbi:MAG: hypothetical protein SGI88_14730 [Candidatus Hydrogenedentes bacterium]|nr:hypothetical protein [Candidatus Hydrogenedentota bacterium]